jgi:hypothetical protein
MRGADHQGVGLATLASGRCEYLAEHPKPAPVDEQIVARLGRLVLRRRTAPPTAVADTKKMTRSSTVHIQGLMTALKRVHPFARYDRVSGKRRPSHDRAW